MKILFSNLGYARGIDGTLWQHVTRAGRHFYCPVSPQQVALNQLKNIMDQAQPDLCCFVEIDSGSLHSGNFNQMEALRDDTYRYAEISNKYGADSVYSRLPFHASKCNGFLARVDYPFEKLFFKAGRKRLIYRITLPGNIALYFAHFSLQAVVRELQFKELEDHIVKDGRRSIVLADFNIFYGFAEISGLLNATGMKLINREDEFTFTFHTRRHVLDLCLASHALAGKIDLEVVPQPFSDHAAICLKLND